MAEILFFRKAARFAPLVFFLLLLAVIGDSCGPNVGAIGKDKGKKTIFIWHLTLEKKTRERYDPISEHECRGGSGLRPAGHASTFFVYIRQVACCARSLFTLWIVILRSEEA